MSSMLTVWAMQAQFDKPLHKLVMIYVAEAGTYEGFWSGSEADLAAFCCTSIPQVRVALRELVNTGRLARKYRGDFVIQLPPGATIRGAL